MSKNGTSTLVAGVIFLLALYMFKNQIMALFNKTGVGVMSSSIPTFGAPTFAGDDSAVGIFVPGASSSAAGTNSFGVVPGQTQGGGILSVSQ